MKVGPGRPLRSRRVGLVQARRAKAQGKGAQGVSVCDHYGSGKNRAAPVRRDMAPMLTRQAHDHTASRAFQLEACIVHLICAFAVHSQRQSTWLLFLRIERHGRPLSRTARISFPFDTAPSARNTSTGESSELVSLQFGVGRVNSAGPARLGSVVSPPASALARVFPSVVGDSCIALT